MKFQKGTPKNPESGRKKGVPNKRSQDLHDICEAKGISPFEALLDLASKGEKEETRLGALKEVCQYLWPKKKAVEHSVADEDGFRIIIDNYINKEK